MKSDIEAYSWAYSYCLKLNEKRTQVISLGSSRLTNKINLNTVPNLLPNDYPLQYCESVKNLR